MDEAGGARNLPPLPFPSLPFPLFVFLVGFKLNTRLQPPPLSGSCCPRVLASWRGAPRTACRRLCASQLGSRLTKSHQFPSPAPAGGPPRLDFTPSQPGPPPACVPPCALSSSGPIPPNVPSRPLPSAPPSWRGYYFILFYFLVLGWPPKSFQPGILLPPSLPLPALRPPGRWKQNLGSSGLEGRGGNLLHGGKMSPARFLPSPRGTRAPDFLRVTSPVAPSAPPGSPEPPHWARRGSGGWPQPEK